MSAQPTYSQATPRGAAGALYDLSAHAVNTRINAETGLTMKFGLGVVQGSAPGSDIKIPATGATAIKFEGITVNGYIKSQTYDRLYPEFTALTLFPVTHEVPEGAETVTYYSYDKTGMAKIISNYATDLPRVDVKGEPTTVPVKSIGDSYG